MKKLLILIVISTATLILVQSCARMGAPDGGWYDETPPRVVGAVPADRAFNVDNGKVRIYFSEFVNQGTRQVCGGEAERYAEGTHDIYH